MNAILGLGKWLLIVPTLIFGAFHFMSADQMAGMAPGGKMMVYFTGICLVLAAISMAIGKMDKLAATLLGVLMILFIIPHAQNLAENQMEMGNILKNLYMAGGAFLYAARFASDDSVIG